MRIYKFIFSLLFLTGFNAICQERIPVTETTLSLSFDQTADFFYSFAAGDEIIFNLTMVQGKHIKAVEIIELPNNVVFSSFKATTIKDKIITVKNKGMYAFRFYSSSLTNRVCRYRIDRIPKNIATKNFNTNWKWSTVRDTIHTPYQEDSLIGYKTIKYQETVKELKKEELKEITILEKTVTVHSYYNENISRTFIKVDLPIINNTSLKEENILAWSYWIGVGQESREAYKNNLVSFSNTVGKVASTYYQSPLAGVALGEITNLIMPQTGEDVQYYLIPDYENAQKFYNNQSFLQYENNKGRAVYGRNDRLKEGTFYLGLFNDNRLRGIEVDVKIMAIKEIKTYENVVYNRERQEPQYTTLNKIKMTINETQIRVPLE